VQGEWVEEGKAQGSDTHVWDGGMSPQLKVRLRLALRLPLNEFSHT